MKPHVPLALLSTLVAGGCLRSPGAPEGIYLFDCGGWIQRVDGIGSSVTAARHVAEIDSTLPDRVRDGCSIHAGWYDRDTGRLVLVVQTQSWLDEDGNLPTKPLALATPALVPQATAGRLQRPPGRPDLEAIASGLQSVESPFAQSIGYVLIDGTTVLLQEVTNATSTPQPVQLNSLWRLGTVSLRQGSPGATGRYALLDITTRAQRGVVVSTTEAVNAHRLVCASPSGRIYLAAARDTLLIVDVMEPTRRSIVGDLTLDLYWTACAGP